MWMIRWNAIDDLLIYKKETTTKQIEEKTKCKDNVSNIQQSRQDGQQTKKYVSACVWCFFFFFIYKYINTSINIWCGIVSFVINNIANVNFIIICCAWCCCCYWCYCSCDMPCCQLLLLHHSFYSIFVISDLDCILWQQRASDFLWTPYFYKFIRIKCTKPNGIIYTISYITYIFVLLCEFFFYCLHRTRRYFFFIFIYLYVLYFFSCSILSQSDG